MNYNLVVINYSFVWITKLVGTLPTFFMLNF